MYIVYNSTKICNTPGCFNHAVSGMDVCMEHLPEPITTTSVEVINTDQLRTLARRW